MHPQGRVAPGENGINCEYFIKDHVGSVRVVYADVDRDEVIDFDTVECELLEEHHYYPFGLEMEGMWSNFRTGQYVNRYTYNGKQAQTEMGWDWLNYGARYYDGLIGRWASVDPLAAKMPAWSPYSYTFNSPLSNVDPDGYEPKDIVIRPKRGDETNAGKRTFQHLQKLTDDKLHYNSQTGKVTISERRSGVKSEGTKIVADLINSPHTINVTNDTEGVKVNGDALKPEDLDNQSITVASDPANASNGVGSGSTIFYSPDVQATYPNMEGGVSISSSELVLGHELIHADHIRTGSKEVSTPPRDARRGKNREEEKTVDRENNLRKEQNQPLRYGH